MSESRRPVRSRRQWLAGRFGRGSFGERWRRIRPLLRGTDLAWAYAVVVAVLTLLINLLPATLSDDVVLKCSTNLNNLREDPIFVLIVSAFVVPSPLGLWILPALVVAYGAAQRWVGRLATMVVAVIGHVGATLFVAVLLVSGLTHGRLDPSIARVPDVGVSYGLAAIAGMLTSRVHQRYRRLYALSIAAYFVGPLLIWTTFTDVGHTTALALGFGLAILAARAASAREQPP